MYNIVIADDEKNIREGIMELIEWEELNCRVCAAFRNGEQVLRYLESGEAVDIVITDIKMPILDGMELTGVLHDKYPEIRTIILTAYSDFSYAQQAIKYQVADFVVKNDFFSELPRAVKKIVRQLEETTRKKNKDIAFFSGPGICRVCAVEIKGEKGNEDEKQIQEVIAGVFQNRQIELIKDTNGLLYILIESSCHTETAEVFEQKIEKAISLAGTFQGIHLRVGVSCQVKKSECMILGKKQAERSLSKVYMDDKPVYIAKKWPEQIVWLNGYDVDGYMRSLYIAVRSGNKEERDQKEQEFREYLSQEERPIEQCRSDTHAILSYIFRKIRGITGGEKFIAPDSVLNAVYSSHSKAALWDALHETCSVIESLISDNGRGQNSLVKKVDHVIEKSYQNKLSLKDISRALFVNSSYLSRVYKKETGHTVTEAVNMYRIKKAKELLQTGEYKVGEAGKMVGIEDPAYFTHVFLKYDGRNPSDYINRQD